MTTNTVTENCPLEMVPIAKEGDVHYSCRPILGGETDSRGYVMSVMGHASSCPHEIEVDVAEPKIPSGKPMAMCKGESSETDPLVHESKEALAIDETVEVTGVWLSVVHTGCDSSRTTDSEKIAWEKMLDTEKLSKSLGSPSYMMV